MLRACTPAVLAGAMLIGSAACRQDPTKEPESLPPIPELQLTRLSDEARSGIELAAERLRQYPGDALLNGELGMQLHANRRYQEAAVMYDRARRIHPEVFRWEYYRGVVLSEVNDVTESAASFKRALEITENEPNALLGLAQLYFKSARLAASDALLAEGEKTLNLLIETNPDYLYGPLLRAGRLEEAGKPDEAIAIYEGMIGKGPSFGLAHQALGRLYGEVGDPDAAARHEALAQQSNQPAPPAQNRWLAAINQLGLSGMGHGARGQMLLQNRLFAPAATEFELAVAEEPRNVDHRVNLVALYAMMRRSDKAREHYQAALRLGGADAKVHLNIGTMLLTDGDLDEAAKAYERALASDGALVKAHLGLGRIASQRKDWRRAESYVQQALTLEPLNPLIHQELARTLREQGKLEEAVATLEKGVSYSEGRTSVRLLRTVAAIHEQRGDKTAAAEALKRARVEAERSESNVDLALIEAQLAEFERSP